MNLVRRAEKHLPQSLLLLCASGCGALDAWWGSWARADDERKGCLVATRNGRSPPRSWCKNAGHPMKTVTTINAEDLAAAQRWFARLLAPDCSDAERAWFEHWRDTAPAHLAAYRQVEDVWQRSERTRQDPAIAAALREARHPASGRARRVWWPALAVAASLLVAVGLMFRHQLLPDNVPAIRYATVLGEQRSVTLKDGSQVILDTASELLVQYGSRERKLTLQRGRADFSVQHDDDAQRPFVVHAATGTVTATGTQFQVRVESGIGTVTLLEGQVRVAAQDGEQQQVA